MNLVDSSGWLEYFADGPNGEFFAAPLADLEHLVVPTISILEVTRRILQQRDANAALQAAAAMRQGRVAELDSAVAVSAAALGVQLRLALADSIILATARAYRATIWTQDVDFKGIDGVRFVARR